MLYLYFIKSYLLDIILHYLCLISVNVGKASSVVLCNVFPILAFISVRSILSITFHSDY